MKKLILLILLLAMAAANATAARMYPTGGRVVDAQGQAVEYATVVLLRGGEQVAGMATDDAGRFELKVPTGEYTLSIQYLGFDPVLRQVRVDADGRIAKLSVISKVGDIRYELTIPRTAAVCTIDGERCAPDEITGGSLIVCDFWGDAQESDGIYRATAFGEVKVMPTAVQS